jgi:hypothetical protein
MRGGFHEVLACHEWRGVRRRLGEEQAPVRERSQGAMPLKRAVIAAVHVKQDLRTCMELEFATARHEVFAFTDHRLLGSKHAQVATECRKLIGGACQDGLAARSATSHEHHID